MKLEEYREYLQGQDVPDDAIEKQMAIIGDFVKFLTALGLKKIRLLPGKRRWRGLPGSLSLKDAILWKISHPCAIMLTGSASASCMWL